MVIQVPGALESASDESCQDWVLLFKAVGCFVAQGVSRNVVYELGPGMGVFILCLVFFFYPAVAELVSKLQDRILFTLPFPLLR